MSQAGIIRNNAILPFIAADSDMTGQEGKPVMTLDPPGGEVYLMDDSAASFTPIGVIVQGGKEGETVSVAIAAGGLAGTVRVKLATAVPRAGQTLQLENLGTYCAFGPDAGSGARTLMAVALEPGFAEEKIEAVLFRPEFISS